MLACSVSVRVHHHDSRAFNDSVRPRWSGSHAARRLVPRSRGSIDGDSGSTNAFTRIRHAGQQVFTEHAAPRGSPSAEDISTHKPPLLLLCGTLSWYTARRKTSALLWQALNKRSRWSQPKNDIKSRGKYIQYILESACAHTSQSLPHELSLP